MWGEIVLQLLLGAAGLVTAIGGLVQARTRQTAAELVSCQETARRWRIAALRHITGLERAWWQAGMAPPVRPDELLS